MPWYQDQNGELVYQLSCYTKEDLPTWNEIYRVFYKRKITEYFPGVDTDEDPYWKLPLNMVIIAMMANQFNKMLVEDDKMESLINYLHEKFEGAKRITHVYWILFQNMEEEVTNTATALTDIAACSRAMLPTILTEYEGKQYPVIYELPQPDGKENPFIVNDHPRTNVKLMDGTLMLIPVYATEDDKAIDVPYDDYLQACMDFMIAPMREYFEGDKVGWKTEAVETPDDEDSDVDA